MRLVAITGMPIVMVWAMPADIALRLLAAQGEIDEAMNPPSEPTERRRADGRIEVPLGSFF